MENTAKILVVDDEAIVCESCIRVLSKEGFRVDINTKPVEGLKMADATDYDAVLLDIKMDEMDGIEFLQSLRKKNPDIPVIIITGYPSFYSATQSMKLGASDYIQKPFTPSEILESVRKQTSRIRIVSAEEKPSEKPVETVQTPPAIAWEAFSENYNFYDESWAKLGKDGSVLVGAVLAEQDKASGLATQLPKVGETIFKGLPLAVVRTKEKTQQVIPSPVSGEIVELNQELARSPSYVWDDPCGKGWIARIKPFELEKEFGALEPRKLVFATTDEEGKERVLCSLQNRGCTVYVSAGMNEAISALRENRCRVLLLDGSSLYPFGPEIVKRINQEFPEVKIVVLEAPECKLEADYRANKIFYYGVKPLADEEITDILFSAFRLKYEFIPDEEASGFLPVCVSRIRMINKNGTKLSLLAFGEIMVYNKNLGRQLIGKMLNKAYPVETVRGVNRCKSCDVAGMEKIIKEQEFCDHLFIMEAKDTGRFPGSLTKELLKREMEKNTTHLVIQPKSSEDTTLDFDGRTSGALADHILMEMESR